jgi:hypothetical protein
MERERDEEVRKTRRFRYLQELGTHR